MMRNSAKKAMTTVSQRACFVIDHLIEALGGQSSSSLRRAMILVDIDENPGTTPTDVMDRLGLHKSALTREIEWLFNYGCIMREESETDGRAIKLVTCGYSKKALEAALDYFDGDHSTMNAFLDGFAKRLRQEKPTLRDARIVSTIFEKGEASKHDISSALFDSSASTESRAINKLIEDGVITGDAI
jgi:DNA-binding MarR family transcriptional regulator